MDLPLCTLNEYTPPQICLLLPEHVMLHLDSGNGPYLS